MAHYVVSLQFQAINGTANQQPWNIFIMVKEI
jgi:hypothetical protein